MKSADVNNIVINQPPNPHSKNPGWEFFPASQIKQQVEIAKQKEQFNPTPTPPSIKIRTIELRAQYKDNTKPKHIFKKVDPKDIGKKKREALEDWIKVENELKKGIQRPLHYKQQKKKLKQPAQDIDLDDQQEQELEQSQQNNEDQEEEQNEIQQNNEQEQEYEEDQGYENQEEQLSQSIEVSQLSQSNAKSKSIINSQIQGQSQFGKSYVSSNISTVAGYKSQVADQMRSLMDDFE